MSNDRWMQLMRDNNEQLTEEEKKEGWHFCYDWDGLLVGPDMPEQEFCHCFEEKNNA